jgi:hypothetical protein
LRRSIGGHWVELKWPTKPLYLGRFVDRGYLGGRVEFLLVWGIEVSKLTCPIPLPLAPGEPAPLLNLSVLNFAALISLYGRATSRHPILTIKNLPSLIITELQHDPSIPPHSRMRGAYMFGC